MQDSIQGTKAWRFFWTITEYPKIIILLSLILVGASGSFVPKLKRDTRSEAFLPADHPVVLYRNKVKKLFGLKDPMVIAVINKGPHGVFTPHTLQLISKLTEDIRTIEGIDPDRITSLATEKDIIGTSEGMQVERFFETPPTTQEEADRVREAVMDFKLYADNLVAKDGSGTYIIAEFQKEDDASRIYNELLALTEKTERDGEELYVAGVGAVSGYLGTYIDQDAQRLNPLCALVISFVLFLAYRNLRGVVLPNLIVLGAVAIAIGTMTAAGIPFYVITNALPVILIALGVAYTIHVLGQYYEEVIQHPELSQRELVVRTMSEMWKPLLSTSVTDVAGFMALFFTSFMPPMKWFGLFATIGVTAELFLALITLPAILTLLKPRPSKAFRIEGVDQYGKTMGRIGVLVYRYPGVILIASLVVVIIGVLGATRLEFNEEWIKNFQEDAPIYKADRAINQTLNGTNFMDVVVETSEPDGLFDPEALTRIEALQHYLETLPHVTNTTSIVDIIKQMNRAVNEDKPEMYRVPESPEAAAQLFLLYEISGDPTDFEEYIDNGHQSANIRVTSNGGRYSDEVVIVEAAEKYIKEHFNTPKMKATLSGNINLDYHWLGTLTEGHFLSVFWSMVGVYLVMIVNFRSIAAAFYGALPIAIAVFMLYAVMGFFNIWLSVGTSMFATIAIGIGVDSAIHTIDHLTLLVRDQHLSLEEAFMKMYTSTGRSLLFSFAGFCLGFCVLLTSQVPPLVRFGALVVIAVTGSFVGSMTMLPALLKVVKPKFLFGNPPTNTANTAVKTAGIVLCGLILGIPAIVTAQSLPAGLEVAQKFNGRDDGKVMARKITMQMTSSKKETMERVTHGYRKYFGQERRTVVIYDSPQNVAGTGFLVYDYAEPGKADDQWLYLPAMRKVRRISAADRGDYFLGTDFTYEDIKNESKVTIEDYNWKTIGRETYEGVNCYVVEAVTINAKIASELGYSKVVRWVDPQIWMARKSEYWDVKGDKLKTLYARDIRQVQGIWTAHRLEMENLKTGHRTVMVFSNIDYQTKVDDDTFTERALQRGK